MNRFLKKAMIVTLTLSCILTIHIPTHASDQYIPLPDSGSITFDSATNEVYTSGATDRPELESFYYTLESYAQLHLAEVNRIRREHGVPELSTEPALDSLAMQRAAEYVGGHKRPDGSDWLTIFDEYDTELKPAGENMGAAGGTPESTARGFLETKHRYNLLNPDATYVGIGTVWVDTVIGPRIAVVQVFASKVA